MPSSTLPGMQTGVSLGMQRILQPAHGLIAGALQRSPPNSLRWHAWVIATSARTRKNRSTVLLIGRESIDLGQCRLDRRGILGTHYPIDLGAALQEDERRPELDGEGAAEASAARVGNLQVAHARMGSEGGGEQRLRAPAVPAPGAAELEQRRSLERVDFVTSRLLIEVGRAHFSHCSTGWDTSNRAIHHSVMGGAQYPLRLCRYNK